MRRPLLCGRHMRSITRLSSPSICLSVRLSCTARSLVTRKQKNWKFRIGINVPRAWLSGVPVPIISWKIKGQGHRMSKISITPYLAYMFTYSKQRRRPKRRLQTRPKPLLGLIYYRRLTRSATGRRPYIMSTVGADIFSCLSRCMEGLIFWCLQN